MYVTTSIAGAWKGPFMAGKQGIRYGLRTLTEILRKTGREILQAIIKKDLPQPPIRMVLEGAR
jgi:hypothetical protein